MTNAQHTHTPGPNRPVVEHWDDERSIGNGIIVTLKPGLHFYDDCGVMGFDKVGEAKAAIRALEQRLLINAIAAAEDDLLGEALRLLHRAFDELGGIDGQTELRGKMLRLLTKAGRVA